MQRQLVRLMPPRFVNWKINWLFIEMRIQSYIVGFVILKMNIKTRCVEQKKRAI